MFLKHNIKKIIKAHLPEPRAFTPDGILIHQWLIWQDEQLLHNKNWNIISFLRPLKFW